MQRAHFATGFAILAAALYAVNVPCSKLLMNAVTPTMLAAFLYLGAGAGMGLLGLTRRLTGHTSRAEPLTRRELPYTVAMVVLDVAAPILLMFGIRSTAAANVSLLNNFEIVATSLLALAIFHEVISRRLWMGIALVTLASVILSVEGGGALSFGRGSLLVLGACVCWGFENNCTRMLSTKSSEEIVTIKGLGSGLGSLVIALACGEPLPGGRWILLTMALGFVAYGLSINFYILAQKELGAAKTSAYYAVAPFLGVAFSMALVGERPGAQFYAGLAVMAVATVVLVRDTISLQHVHAHQHIHTHAHSHGSLCHTHPHVHTHTHLHVHTDGGEAHSHTHTDLPDHNHSHPPVQPPL